MKNEPRSSACAHARERSLGSGQRTVARDGTVRARAVRFIDSLVTTFGVLPVEPITYYFA